MSETVFQKVFRQYDEWEASGSHGPAPARVAFRHVDVSALVDPFRKLPGTLVVIPNEATPGEDHHLAHLSASRRMQIALVCLEFGKKIITQTGIRAIEHTEGYGVPDHAHTVILPAARGVGKALYAEAIEPVLTMDEELDGTLEQFGIRGIEAVILSRRLDIVSSAAAMFDDLPPEGINAGLRSFADRVTLAT